MGHETRRDVGGKAAAGGEENGKGGEGEDPFGTQVKEKHYVQRMCGALGSETRAALPTCAWTCNYSSNHQSNHQGKKKQENNIHVRA